MFLNDFLKGIQTLGLIQYESYLEDCVDRIAFGWTAICLLLMTTLLMAKQYIFTNIACVALTYPQQVVNGIAYIENYCWNTQNNVHRSLGFMLGFMGIMVYLPRIIWQMICHHSAYTSLFERVKIMKPKQFMQECRRASQRYCFKIFFFLYLFHKLIYISCNMGMVLLLQHLIKLKTSLFGIYDQSDYFPITLLCDYELPHLGSMNSYSAQCVLPNNYLFHCCIRFLWYWFISTSCLLFLSCFYWLLRYASLQHSIRSYEFFLLVLRYKFGFAFVHTLQSEAINEIGV